MKRLASLALLGLLAAACGSTSGAEDLFSSGGTTGSGVTGATAGAGGATSGSGGATGSTTGSGPTSTGSGTTGQGGASTSTGSASTGTGMGGAAATSSSEATSTSSSTTSTSEATSASSGNPLSDIGCSDGTREYFADLNQYPDIAGCAGGFLVPGVTTDASKQPQCNRMAGNDGQFPNGGDPNNNNGAKCSVEDLCADGWHVCHGAIDVQSKNPSGCDPQVGDNQFWLTRQVQNGQGVCSQPPSVNNLNGCGSLGNPTGQQAGWNCSPLTTWMNYQVCIPTQAWFCGNGQQNSPQSGFYNEAEIVVKVGPTEGGVLCCRN